VYRLQPTHYLPSIVQAIGRLRPGQRKKSGWIQIVLPVLTPRQCKIRLEEARWTYDFLTLHDYVPANFELYCRVMTPVGLYDWVKGGGCRLRKLSRFFGCEATLCGVCLGCRESPVRRLAESALSKDQRTAADANTVRRIFHHLSLCCISCSGANCDGETCLPSGPHPCFNCGELVQSLRNCPVDVQQIFDMRGCYGCFDGVKGDGYQNHDVGACSVRRRFKRFLFQNWRKGEPQPQPQPFLLF
jgi:hypothetical protein